MSRAFVRLTIGACGLVCALVCALRGAEAASLPTPDSHMIRQKSAYSVDETVARLKADIAAKKIRFFDNIDQGALASGAGLGLSWEHIGLSRDFLWDRAAQSAGRRRSLNLGHVRTAA